MEYIGNLIGRTLKNKNNQEELDKIKQEVVAITAKYPMFAEEWNVAN